MPMSLSSLLQTYPYKTRACMERVSSVLKLSTNVTVDKMRTQILDYAERNNAEEKIRDLAFQHKQIEAKKMKNASSQPSTSTPAMSAFNQPSSSQCTSPHPPISPSLFSNFDEENSQNEQSQIHNDIDELMQMGNDLTQMFEQSVSESDENDSTLENSQTPNPIADSARQKCPLVSSVPINDSMWDDQGLNLSNTQERKVNFMISESIKIIAAKDTQIMNLEENLKTVCDMNAQMCNENAKTRSLMSTLIQQLQEEKQQRNVMQAEIEIRDRSIHELMCSIKDDIKKIIQKNETDSSSSSSPVTIPPNPPPSCAVPLSATTPSFIPSSSFPSSSYANATSMPNVTVPNVTVPNVTEPNVIVPNVTVPKVTESNIIVPNVTMHNVTVPNPNVTVPNVTEPNVTVPNVTEPNVTVLNVTVPNVTVPESAAQTSPPSSLSEQSPATTSTESSSAQTTETATATTNSTENRSRRQRIVVITDSNGECLKAQELMPGAEVRKKVRYHLKEAMRLTPKVTKPEEIDDVVFQIGLNDLRGGFEAKEIVEKHFEMQVMYKRFFPNARQHVTALPPLSSEHIHVNKGLQKLCNNLGCNFIHIMTN